MTKRTKGRLPRPVVEAARSDVEKEKSPRLAELQALFQDAIVNGNTDVFRLVLDNSRTTRETLFGVYAHAYGARLTEILRNEYPLLAAYVDEDAFNGIAESYIGDHPSRTCNARWFGGRLPEYLQLSKTYAARPELGELAAIERATADAFDAADASVLHIGEVSNYAPRDWPFLVFKPHPSTRLLNLQTNAFAVWQALKRSDTVPEPVRGMTPQWLCVWRQGATPQLRQMPEQEAMMWIEAAKGVRFEVLCEMLATFDDPDGAPMRAAGFLHGWIASEMLSTAWSASPPRRRKRLSKAAHMPS